jgi:hypothetical protein
MSRKSSVSKSWITAPERTDTPKAARELDDPASLHLVHLSVTVGSSQHGERGEGHRAGWVVIDVVEQSRGPLGVTTTGAVVPVQKMRGRSRSQESDNVAHRVSRGGPNAVGSQGRTNLASASSPSVSPRR